QGTRGTPSRGPSTRRSGVALGTAFGLPSFHSRLPGHIAELSCPLPGALRSGSPRDVWAHWHCFCGKQDVCHHRFSDPATCRLQHAANGLPKSAHVDTLLRPLLRRAPSEFQPAKTTSGDLSGDTLPDANRKIQSQFRPRLNARTALSG